MTWMDRRGSRRGFLYRVGVLAAGAGAWFLGAASTAQAALYCCCCTACGGCPATVGVCPAGYSNQHYTWTCCSFGRVVYCWDCLSPKGVSCVCTKKTGGTC